MTQVTDTHPEGYDPIRDGGADGPDQRQEADLDEQAEYYDYEYEDNYEDDYDSSDYSAGYHDGYCAALAHMRLSYRLKTAIPYRWRAKYYALRRKLFPRNSDTPF